MIVIFGLTISLSILGCAERLYSVNSNSTTIKEETMKYLCLIYIDEKKVDAIPKSELDALLDETSAYNEMLQQSGHLINAAGLKPVQTATTLRMRKGKLSITDGPFAETKEVLGGFYVIEARDLNEAIQLASKSSSLRLGSVEVRPIDELIQP
jgi:hypothetical protein